MIMNGGKLEDILGFGENSRSGVEANRPESGGQGAGRSGNHRLPIAVWP